ncbi:MAG TPA: malto-oligosyltrehalose trehalohydrolase [Stellaceae bacterium]
MIDRFSYAASFGANYIGNGRTRFRFWAPTQKQVALVLSNAGNIALPMDIQPGGWFELEADCAAMMPYRYRLDNGMLVPDPASRLQHDDVRDPSIVVDPAAYRWQHADWPGRPWHDTVLYELHVGALGGFVGVRRALPRLAALGITAVELMPINDFPGRRNWGYDGVLPYAPDTSYGSPEELKALIDAAHGLGLMIFLDVVYNHFGPDGNYFGAYAPQIFRADFHSAWGASLDFTQPELRRFFTENAIYWLMEYRFDGLRFDAVHAIGDPTWLTETATAIRRAVEPRRQVHLVLEDDRNEAHLLKQAYDAQWNDDGHHALHVLLTGETDGYYIDYADRPAARLARCLQDGFIYQGEPSSHRNGAPRGEPSGALPPTAFVLFLQNHDQIGNRPLGDRLTAGVAPAAIEAALALLLLTPQIPMLFMGEEDASQTPFLFFTDHHGALAEAVREGRRHEFAHFAAFADPVNQARIPDPNAEATFLASIPKPDPEHATERFAFIRRLLGVRRDTIVPHLDGTHALGASAIGPAAVTAAWRLGDGAVLTIIANLGADAAAVPAPDGALLFESGDGVAARLAEDGLMPPHATTAYWHAPS